MILGTPGSEQFRYRVGWLFLAFGVALVLVAWGSWIYRVSMRGESEISVPELDTESTLGDAGRNSLGDEGIPTMARQAAVGLLPLWLMSTLLLLLSFLFGSYAITRASRRYRAAAERQRASPTASEDAWSMYKLPDDDLNRF